MKKKYFLDSNIILRFLLNDHKKLSKQARKYFTKAQDNKAVLFSTNLVIAELIWVLKSVYKKSIQEIYSAIKDLLSAKIFYD